jgi:hypothetical protein
MPLKTAGVHLSVTKKLKSPFPKNKTQKAPLPRQRQRTMRASELMAAMRKAIEEALVHECGIMVLSPKAAEMGGGKFLV